MRSYKSDFYDFFDVATHKKSIGGEKGQNRMKNVQSTGRREFDKRLMRILFLIFQAILFPQTSIVT